MNKDQHNITKPVNEIPPLGGGGAYLLHLADSALILSQRQSEWCGHGPILEQDIAITNISLDLLGQARNFYQYAAQKIGGEMEKQFANHPPPLEGLGEATEDSLAYLRTEREFKNFILCELPNGDWAQTILKLYLFSEYQHLLLSALKKSADAQIAAIAEKSLKETTYHLRWSKEWVIRLGDGTDESKHRMELAVEQLWKHTREFFEPTDYEKEVVQHNIGVDTTTFKEAWLQNVKETYAEATLNNDINITDGWTGLKGKEGTHTEHLGFILTELQYLQRTYPNSEW
jgi:ring-1,2-phenylacetyl-CoA epoxidase subunit PaaC